MATYKTRHRSYRDLSDLLEPARIRIREPSREAGVNAALPNCGTVPMRPYRAPDHSLAAASGLVLSGRVF